MSKRRRRRPRGSNQPPQRGSNPKLQPAAKQKHHGAIPPPQFTSAELAFFDAGERVHETHVEYEAERPSLWRRFVARITLDV